MKPSPEIKYRVGVIGCGRAGTGRARAFDLHPLCAVAAIADTDADNLALGCERFGVPGYNTWEEMFASEEIDIAMPVLPVRPNADAVVASAEAGVKAIFCEKPFTNSLADADRMVEACSSRGVHIASGVMVSSHPDYQKAYELAASGEIGEVRRINLYENNAQGGCHGLNLARKFAAKSPVETVTGRVEGDPFSDYEEPYEEGDSGFGGVGGTIRFANGIECFSSFGDVPWRGIEVVGTRGVIYNRNNTSLGLTLLKAEGEGPVKGVQDLTVVEGVFEEHNEEPREYDDEGWMDPGPSMREIVRALVEALETGVELPVTTGDDLRHALEIALALRESHRRGSDVSLPLEDRSLVMYPQKMRWYYKKDLHGKEWYAEQMAKAKRA
ncbi:MAG: Gfo/Idh/MocA family oxidoreductase [bacterium]